ncbi:MAG: OmpA family protein [Croceibacterium sp.]
MAIVGKPLVIILAGTLAVAALAAIAGSVTGPRMAAKLQAQSAIAIARAHAQPVRASFSSINGWPTRHPVLSGGEKLDEATRARAAQAVASVPGVAGVMWLDSSRFGSQAEKPPEPLNCQADVEALLRARTIRFEESSARIDAASQELVGQVAAALRPCLGNIIAITGHTDSSGPEPGNLELSLVRAEAVRDALIARGIPSDGLRTQGLGSRRPVKGLEPTDPANRRIEFSVIASVPVKPTPVDTPGPR